MSKGWDWNSFLQTDPMSADPSLVPSVFGRQLLAVDDATGALNLIGAEPALGNPAADGYVLVSTAAGVRSWASTPSLPSQGGHSGQFLTTNGTSASWAAITAPVWGAITGTLSSQTDLQAALDAKQSLAGVLALGGFSSITGTVPIPVGKTLYVDSVNGNDGTAVSGRADKPYITLTAAKTAAASGDLIVVGPGAYTTSASLAKNGVNWHFAPGATVSWLSATGGSVMWGDGGTAMTYQVTGSADFVMSSTAGTRVALHLQTSSGSVISIQHHNATVTGSNANHSIFEIDAGMVIYWFNEVSATNGSNLYGVWWKNGTMQVRGNKITADYPFVLEAAAVPTGDCFIDVEDIVGLAPAPTIYCPGTGVAAASWVKAKTIRASSAGTSLGISAGKVYIEAQKLIGPVTMLGGLLYVDTFKMSKTANAQRFISVSGGTSWFRIDHLDDAGFNNAIVSINGGVSTMSGATATAGASSEGIIVEGGTLNLHDWQIDTSLNAATNAIDVYEGTLNLHDCSVVSNAGMKDLTNDAGTANVIGGRGTNANGTFTTTGTITYFNPILVGDDTAYDATSWNGDTGVPTKNAVRDKFETLRIGTDVQAYDADLTSWAAITRASGFDTFAATPSGANLASLLTTALPATKGGTGLTSLGTGVATALGVNVGSAGAFVTFNGALGTPSSGSAANLTSFPTLNQNTTGSAASLSVSGQTGLLTFTGLTSTNRAKTVRDAADTILELGGSYTPTGTWTNMTLVTPTLGAATVTSLLFTDSTLLRESANILAQRNGTSSQTFRVYNSYTNDSNRKYLELTGIFSSGNPGIYADGAGTGVNPDLYVGTIGTGAVRISPGGTIRWLINSSGHFLTGADNSYDIGASGATRPRTGYFGTSVIAPTHTHTGVTVANLPASPAAGQVAYVTDGSGTPAWGDTVTGGGSTKILVWYNGTNWTAIGK